MAQAAFLPQCYLLSSFQVTATSVLCYNTKFILEFSNEELKFKLISLNFWPSIYVVKAHELIKYHTAREFLETASIRTLAYMHQLKRSPTCFVFTENIFVSSYSSDSTLTVSTHHRDFMARKETG